MKRSVLFSVLAGALAISGSAFSKGNAAAGKAKAVTCVACHGAEGIAPAGTPYPHLACQKEAYLLKQMKAFKSGTRPEPLMKPMMMALTDADMVNLAAYYAEMKKCK